MVVVVSVVALRAQPTSTPPVAPFQPQLQERLEILRQEQASRFGAGAGGAGGQCAVGEPGCIGGSPPPTPPSQPPREGVAYRACVQGPGGPRQTDDPQSPPCKQEVFTGANGGSTSVGVTATEIRIAVPVIADTWETKAQEVLAPVAAHIERHYELYGRGIRLIEVAVPEGADTADPTFQRAFAREVADREPFAVLDFEGFGTFQTELARLGIISMIGVRDGAFPESELSGLHPYVWSVYPSSEETLDATGELACEALKGRHAKHGGADVAGRTRRFAIIQEVPSRDGSYYRADRLVSRLRGCGVQPELFDSLHGRTDVSVLMRRIRDTGATTIVCSCAKLYREYQEGAQDMGYGPEWLLTGVEDSGLYLRQISTQDQNQDVHPREQLAHTFGITGALRSASHNVRSGQDQHDEQYWFHAARDGDPTFGARFHHLSGTYYAYYAQMLILASGVQWAGPRLTPQTFAGALTSIRYPSPWVGRAPFWQPSVGFGRSDHGFNSDVALLWWKDPSDAEYQARTYFGELCYVGNGRRYRPDKLPAGADALFFDPAAGCR